ncbi:MAG: citrate/2-methylcitrate synthase [Candidatus Nitrosocosmicus sp.]
MDTRNIGLRNIEVADTKICSIDGENGKLIYRGYDILDLANHSTYEETAYLLLFGDLPLKDELNEFNNKLIDLRKIPESIIKNMKNKPITAHPMDILQSSVLELADYDINRADDGKESNLARAISLIAKIPTIVAAWERVRNGMEVIEPLIDNYHAHNFLFMLKGEHPKHEVSKIFDISLVLHAEHSFNASTFAAREIASTRASIYACVGGALGALSGELHGGANIQVMKMLLEISDINNVETWIKNRIESGGRVMGMGHAVYRTTDPRSEVLATLSRAISKEKNTKWYEMTEKVERVTKKIMLESRKMLIYPNVDLYSASLYYSLGIPIDLNTPIFAISRIAGWNAHVIEEKFAEAAPKPALYRPKAVYVGRYCGPMGCEYTNVINRKSKTIQ